MKKNLVKKSVFGEHPFLEFILKLIVILVDGTPEVVFRLAQQTSSLVSLWSGKRVTITFPGDYEFESAYKNYVQHRCK